MNAPQLRQDQEAYYHKAENRVYLEPDFWDLEILEEDLYEVECEIEYEQSQVSVRDATDECR